MTHQPSVVWIISICLYLRNLLVQSCVKLVVHVEKTKVTQCGL